jgi:hypothetical protein
VKFSIYNALIYVPFYGRVMSAHAAGAVFEVGTLLLRKKTLVYSEAPMEK